LITKNKARQQIRLAAKRPKCHAE